MNVANLVIPAIRWDASRGYEAWRPLIERALQLEVGGFILHGGDEDGVRQLTKELRRRSRIPLLIAAEMERGAGQQFSGATGLPPAAAIASLNDSDALRRAARLTAREARTLGVNFAFAPVCDLDIEPGNPVTGTRILGSDAERVASLAATWITACQEEGVLACAKHFPGHGRSKVDPRVEVPVVDASRLELTEQDMRPFRAAIDSGVAAIMMAHVVYPALDASGAPATLSREIVQWLLRQQLGFDGLVLTDTLHGRALRPGRAEADVAVEALNAGCDLILEPSELEAMVEALRRARSQHRLLEENVRSSLRRRLKWAQWASPPNEWRKPAAADVAWGHRLADSVVRMVRGVRPPVAQPLDVLVIDDEQRSAESSTEREPFIRALRDAGWDARRVELAGADAEWAPTPKQQPRSRVIALFGEGRGGDGAGYSDATRAAVESAIERAPGALLMQFGHPRLIRDLPPGPPIATAWGGECAMQQAAARWLTSDG
jgi:beta-glucosidase-like glycosyl hydrolase